MTRTPEPLTFEVAEQIWDIFVKHGIADAETSQRESFIDAQVRRVEYEFPIYAARKGWSKFLRKSFSTRPDGYLGETWTLHAPFHRDQTSVAAAQADLFTLLVEAIPAVPKIAQHEG